MMRLCAFAIVLLLPTAAVAQAATQNVPPPGTINDGKPLKTAADGPPRSLIRFDGPAVPKQMILADASKSP